MTRETDGNRSPSEIVADAAARFEDDGTSRRRVLAGTMAGVGALGAFPGVALGDEHHGAKRKDDDGEPDPMDDEAPDGMFDDDIDILNYALTLEYLEAEFYRHGLANIHEGDLRRAAVVDAYDDPVLEMLDAELHTIRDHEETHVDVLSETIAALGGEPIERPEFDFGSATENAEEFLATAVVLEDTGVGAYAGAAPFIENTDLVPPALSIHSVEARHASYLRTLTGQTGFPNAFDPALSRDEVLERAGPFIVSDADADDE